MKNKNMFEKAMSLFKTHHVSHRNFRKLNFEKLCVDIPEGSRSRLKNDTLEKLNFLKLKMTTQLKRKII